MRRSASTLALGALLIALLMPVVALALHADEHAGCSCSESACFCDHRSASRGDCSTGLQITAAGCSRRPAGEANLTPGVPKGELVAAKATLPRISLHIFLPTTSARPAPIALPVEAPPPRA